MSGWSPDHTNMVAIGIAVASEVIGALPVKSNSVVQIVLNTVLSLARRLFGLRGTTK